MKYVFRKPLFALLALFVLAISSCSKNDSNPGPNPIPTKKLVRMEESDQSITTFTYNTDGTVRKIQTSDVNEDDNTMTFSYANNKIASITNTDGSKIAYVYEGGKITRADIFDAANNKVSFNDYTYQNGKVTAVSAKMRAGEDVESPFIEYLKTSFTYYGTGDTKDMTISIFNPLTNELELSEKRTFEQYDNKLNPLAQLGDFSLVFLMDMSTRNVLTEKSYDADGALTETVENQYTYDDGRSYPLQVSTKTTPANGTP